MPIERARFHAVVLLLICVAVIAALLAATIGAGVGALGMRELVSGPGLPSPDRLLTAPAPGSHAANRPAARPAP